MNRICITTMLIAVSLVTVTNALILGQKADKKRQYNVEQEILKLEKEWIDAYFRWDIDALNRIEADDFHVLHSGANIPRTKEEQLAIIKTATEAQKKQLAASTRTVEQVKIRIYGNVVVITSVDTQTWPSTKVIGEIRSGKDLYTGIWVKRNGRWQIVNAQWTALPVQKP